MKRTFLQIDKFATFEQPVDCCCPSHIPQLELEVETCDGGGGPYIVFSTNRWAIDPNDKKDVDAFIKALKDVLKGAGCISDFSKEKDDEVR